MYKTKYCCEVKLGRLLVIINIHASTKNMMPISQDESASRKQEHECDGEDVHKAEKGN